MRRSTNQIANSAHRTRTGEKTRQNATQRPVSGLMVACRASESEYCIPNTQPALAMTFPNDSNIQWYYRRKQTNHRCGDSARNARASRLTPLCVDGAAEHLAFGHFTRCVNGTADLLAALEPVQHIDRIERARDQVTLDQTAAVFFQKRRLHRRLDPLSNTVQAETFG